MNTKILRRSIAAVATLGMFVAGLNSPSQAAGVTAADLESQTVSAVASTRGKAIKTDPCLDKIADRIVANALRTPAVRDGASLADLQTCRATTMSFPTLIGPTTGQAWVDTVMRVPAGRDAIMDPAVARIGVSSALTRDGQWITVVGLADGKTLAEQVRDQQAAAKKKAEHRKAAAKKKAAAKRKAAKKRYVAKYKKCTRSAKKKSSTGAKRKSRYRCQNAAKKSCIKIATSKSAVTQCKRTYRRR